LTLTAPALPAGFLSFACMNLQIDILTVLPELLESPFNHSILKRAKEKGLLEIRLHHLRQWAVNEYGQVDDYQYGGGAGMVMMAEPLASAIEALSKEKTFDEIIYVTPDGERFNQKIANGLSLKGNLLLICGHYKGIDQRIRDTVIDEEISIGDYVLTNGTLAAAVVIDALARFIPGVLGEEKSLTSESFTRNLLDFPNYTRPAVYRGQSVPEVLLQGNHGEIEKWRHAQQLAKTAKIRPDLLK